ncbi:hypothetical protein [Roseibium alexandrii]|uniref:hypothetical protein n=1 Tax=Roseibium alexandrii TaxID=388408 RepID=UPI0037506285
MHPTLLRLDPSECISRIEQMDLNTEGLLRAADAAVSAASDASPFDPSNASGTFAYIFGTRAMREEFVSSRWTVDRQEAVEAIRNESLKIRVVFQNVDVACNEKLQPKPRSKKGAGSERTCSENMLFDAEAIPHYTPAPTKGDYATYYLMVDESGACELSCPIVMNGTFTSFLERIFLTDSSGIPVTLSQDEDNDAVESFDPPVVRKK